MGSYINYVVFMSVVATIWGKANIISSVICGVITYTFAYLCEWFVSFEVYKFDMELLSNNPRIRAAIGFIPISMLFVIWLAVYYIKKNIKKKEEGKDAAVREDIQ